MSGDVTEQALSRLSHLPGSTNPADLIAAQKYFDVEFTGGTISNCNIIGGTISGVAITLDSIDNTPIGATTPSTGAFTTLSASSTVSGAGFSAYFASPPAIGSTVPSSGNFTTLSASSAVSGTGFDSYLASPPAIGGALSAAGNFTTLNVTGATPIGYGLYKASGPALAFSVNSSARAYILPSNGFYVSTSAPVTVAGANGQSAIISAASAGNGGLNISNWGSSQGVLSFLNSAGAPIGTHGALGSSALIGDIDFYGDDGTNYTRSVSLRASTDGTISTSIVPGRYSIFTMTSVGALTEAVRIDSAQNLNMKVASGGLVLKQGANGKCGTFVANGATPVTVNNTSIALTDTVLYDLNTVGGTVGAHPSTKTKTAATGFTVACTALDTSTYNYVIISNA